MAHWISPILFSLATLIPFLKWLTGDKGEDIAKARLDAWYDYVGEGGFSRLIQNAASSTEGFIRSILGPNGITADALFGWFLVAEALGISIGLTLIPVFWPDIAKLGFLAKAAFCAMTVFLLFPVDFLLLVCSRYLFEHIEKTNGVKPGILYLVFVTGAVTLCCFLTLYVMGAFNVHRAFDIETLKWTFVRGLEWPYVIWVQPVTLFFIIPLMLSTILFGAVILGALSLQAFRPILEPVALLLIKRLTSSSIGVFASISALLLGIGVLIDAWTK